MLPMIAIAVLACVLGYYIKNKFFKNDEKDEEFGVQLFNIYKINVPLRSWKAGRFLVVSLLLTVRPIVTCGSRVSRAPPHYTLPAFLNLHGTFLKTLSKPDLFRTLSLTSMRQMAICNFLTLLFFKHIQVTKNSFLFDSALTSKCSKIIINQVKLDYV